MDLRLPPGYRAGMDPDLLIVEREDGSTVAAFSRLGFAKEAVERAAWEDFGEGLNKSRCSPAGRPWTTRGPSPELRP